MSRFYKRITIIASLVSIVFLALAAVEENFLAEWKGHQARFKQILKAKAKTDIQKRAAEEFAIEIRQVLLPDFGTVDRCISCHTGIDNPAMADQPLPYKTHSGDYVKNHPVEKFGCTICHQGQGRALSVEQAFARREGVHWAYPVLDLKYTQASCGKCHLSVHDENSTLEGAERLVRGRDLFLTKGCLGCHKVRDVGGNIGPDLTAEGEKTKHGFSFEYIEGEHTVENWLREHFVDPQAVVPGSLMPAVDLSEEDLDALVTFSMSLYEPKLPPKYYTLDYVGEFLEGRKPLMAQALYARSCAVCHGENAEGQVMPTAGTFVPTLNNEDFLSSASDDYLRHTIRFGRTGQLMSSWQKENGGLTDEEIEALVQYLRDFEPEPPTYAEVRKAKVSLEDGEKLYRTRCAGCHGLNGEGGIGPALNNQDFLAIADKEFLYETIVRGRSNTAMVSHKWLSANELASVIAYVEKWREGRPVRLSDERIAGDVQNGETLYQGLCAGCHGTRGEGAVGTALWNPDFLAVAKDEFIRESILRGRRHRAMRPWQKSGLSLMELSDSDVNDIVAFIRSREGVPMDEIVSRPVLGTPSLGKELYEGMCAGCHGMNGEGGVGPALNNPDFLRAATNGFIQASIVRGRGGTPMRPWGLGTAGLEELTAQQVNDITAYIRSWQKPEPAATPRANIVAKK